MVYEYRVPPSGKTKGLLEPIDLNLKIIFCVDYGFSSIFLLQTHFFEAVPLSYFLGFSAFDAACPKGFGETGC
jgi:hypothetical protein